MTELPTSLIDVTSYVLIEHMRVDIARCHCGWGSYAGNLGESPTPDMSRRRCLKLACYGPPREEATMPNRVQLRSEVNDGIRCAVCEQRFKPGDQHGRLGQMGEEVHEPECPDYFGGPDA